MTERRAELGIAGEVIPKHWEETVAACLAKDPDQRPQSATEVKNRLKLTASSAGVGAQSTVGRKSEIYREETPSVANSLYPQALVGDSRNFSPPGVSDRILFVSSADRTQSWKNCSALCHKLLGKRRFSVGTGTVLQPSVSR